MARIFLLDIGLPRTPPPTSNHNIILNIFLLKCLLTRPEKRSHSDQRGRDHQLPADQADERWRSHSQGDVVDHNRRKLPKPPGEDRRKDRQIEGGSGLRYEETP